MSMYAAALLLLATIVLERDAIRNLPKFHGNEMLYLGLVLNCALAMSSNYLNLCVTQATSPLTLQARHKHEHACLLLYIACLWFPSEAINS